MDKEQEMYLTISRLPEYIAENFFAIQDFRAMTFAIGLILILSVIVIGCVLVRIEKQIRELNEVIKGEKEKKENEQIV